MKTKKQRFIFPLLTFVFALAIFTACNSAAPQEAKPFPNEAVPAAAISGGHMAMTILEDNSLWAWGWHVPDLRRGGGHTTNEAHFYPVHLADDILYATFVSGGFGHMFAISAEGTLWGMGNNLFGQLGDGSARSRVSPVEIMENVAAVSAGRQHTLALTNTGALYAWGININGQIGDGTTRNRNRPVRVMENVAAISAGVQHSLALTTEGVLYSWGGNSGGQLGDGTTENRGSPIRVKENVYAIAAGEFHSMAVTDNGELFTWGSNSDGQLGSGTTENSSRPVYVKENVAAIYANYLSSFAIDANGNLYAWGNNSGGQLGDGTTISRSAPVRVLENVVSISSEGKRTLAITSDMTVWSWGEYLIGVMRCTNQGHEIRESPAIILDSGGFVPDSLPLVSRWRLIPEHDRISENPRLEFFSTANCELMASIMFVFHYNGTLYIEYEAGTSLHHRPFDALITAREILTWELAADNRLILTCAEGTGLFDGVYEITSLYKTSNSRGPYNNLVLYSNGEKYEFFREFNNMQELVNCRCRHCR
jgi:alpha-tubulin suppressor-like RCC1 family protein